MTKETIEVRVLDAEIEIRKDENTPLRISGYAARFNEPSLPLGGGRFVETIAPGAFRNALGKKENVPLLIEHAGLPLADTTTGTLTLSEDSKGLRFEAELDATDPDAQRVLPKLSRGTLRKMSFGFSIAKDGEEWDLSQTPRQRTLRNVESLVDLSIVTSPAYPTTSVALRSLDAAEAAQQTESYTQRELRRRRLRIVDKF